ncbi:Putative zn(2)Cys(6) fungal-type DNA-binding domain-containing protein [Colletotrichum destructivum]|uniref:Zn(2)Cys(6) fungal-type DNA-binding domain-containing protein n=1 Tax=Colletotrichum destructivum TaxID=34406 RepID=A0AAX4J3Q7_9PEZI|nr:Putative zn(2)Cys(6) fungal-type DNA-binding domain-containing protein [Colletotrichum destructivum]
MPNTGKPNSNCYLSRQRRAKCDLARPRCQRCVKYGVECRSVTDPEFGLSAAAAKYQSMHRKRMPSDGKSNAK